MFNPERILGQLLTSGLGSRRGSRRSTQSGILGNIGTASMGMGLLGVAVAAFEHFNDKSETATATTPPTTPGQAGMAPPPPPPTASAGTNQTPPPPPSNTTITPTQPITAALVVLRVMIAAANADGVIDDNERAAILQHGGNNLSPNDQQGLIQELNQPQTLSTLLPLIDSEHAADCYAAAVLTMATASPAEQDFLDQLAAGIKLDGPSRQTIHQQLGVK